MWHFHKKFTSTSHFNVLVQVKTHNKNYGSYDVIETWHKPKGCAVTIAQISLSPFAIFKDCKKSRQVVLRTAPTFYASLRMPFGNVLFSALLQVVDMKLGRPFRYIRCQCKRSQNFEWSYVRKSSRNMHNFRLY